MISKLGSGFEGSSRVLGFEFRVTGLEFQGFGLRA